jgi:hypothetical protein
MPETVTIEGNVTTAELADESARIERATAGQELPRTLHALAMRGTSPALGIRGAQPWATTALHCLATEHAIHHDQRHAPGSYCQRSANRRLPRRSQLLSNRAGIAARGIARAPAGPRLKRDTRDEDAEHRRGNDYRVKRAASRE